MMNRNSLDDCCIRGEPRIDRSFFSCCWSCYREGDNLSLGLMSCFKRNDRSTDGDKETSGLVNPCAIPKEMKKEKNRSGWNILHRESSADSRNSSHAKQRQFGSMGGSPTDKRLVNARRQTTDTTSNVGTSSGRMSIVTKDWEAVHKVHDPDSAVGGVYIGDDEGKEKKDFQGAFTAMKISQSTDRKMTMIDDEA